MANVDPDVHPTVEFKDGGADGPLVVKKRKKGVGKPGESYTFKETDGLRPVKKMSGFVDLNYITSSPEKLGLDKEDPLKKEYNVAGVQLKI